MPEKASLLGFSRSKLCWLFAIPDNQLRYDRNVE